MSMHLREHLSDALINGGAERALDLQAMEREIAAVSPDTPGYWGAHRAMRSAQRAEALMRWLGFRLQPRATLFREDQLRAHDDLS